jgi:hypothetical protein
MTIEPCYGQCLRDDLWLTVKEFAAKVNMPEHSVREAIRKGRLAYRVERLTNGKRGAIRIVFPRRAA